MKHKHIAKHIKALRKKAKMTQQEVADAIGMKVQQLSAIERGVQGLPKRYIVPLGLLFNTEQSEIAQAMLYDYEAKLRVYIQAQMRELDIMKSDHIAERKLMKHEERIEGAATIPHLGEIR